MQLNLLQPQKQCHCINWDGFGFMQFYYVFFYYKIKLMQWEFCSDYAMHQITRSILPILNSIHFTQTKYSLSLSFLFGCLALFLIVYVCVVFMSACDLVFFLLKYALSNVAFYDALFRVHIEDCLETIVLSKTFTHNLPWHRFLVYWKFIFERCFSYLWNLVYCKSHCIRKLNSTNWIVVHTFSVIINFLDHFHCTCS